MAAVSRKALYEALDVDEKADSDEIRRAYRRAVKKAHPDTGGSKEAFEKVSRSGMQVFGKAGAGWDKIEWALEYDLKGTIIEEGAK